MKVIILEPSAVGFDRTHNLNSIIGYSEYFNRNHIRTIWVTNRQCKIQYGDIPNHPLFAYTIYDDVRSAGKDDLLRMKLSPHTDLFENSKHLILDTKEIIEQVMSKEQITSNDHLFTATTDWIMFCALMLTISDDSIQTPFVHLHFLYEKANWMAGGYPYESILTQLRQCDRLNTKVFAYTETKIHAQNMSAALGTTVENCMYPTLHRGMCAQPPKPRSKKTVGLLGGGRWDKGFHLLPGIIKEFDSINDHRDTVEFIVQKPRVEDNLETQILELQSIPNVTIKDNQLDNEEYQQCLQICDCMIFPYDKDIYQTRGSGIVSEAVAAAIPIVCMDGTALEESLTHGNGLVASTPAEFAAGILHIIENFDRFKQNAEAAARYYVHCMQFNPVVRNMLAAENRTVKGNPRFASLNVRKTITKQRKVTAIKLR